MKLHENEPLGSVIMFVPLNVPTEQAVGGRTVPLKVTFATELGVKSEPTTVNGVPVGPCTGVTAIAGPVAAERGPDPAFGAPPGLVAGGNARRLAEASTANTSRTQIEDPILNA